MSESKKSFLSGLATVWPRDEEQDLQTVYFQPPRKKQYNTRWLLLWQDESEIGVSIVEQAKFEKPLTQTEYRVRDYILGTIGIGNYCYINQAEVGRQLRLERAHVSRAIKRLIELEIIIAGPKSGKSNTYMINPAFCFVGKIGDGVIARKSAIKTGHAKIINFNKQ